LATSNHRKVLKQSFIVALVVWLLVLLVIQHYSGSWIYAVVVSLEAGGILAAGLAAIYYHLVLRLNKVD